MAIQVGTFGLSVVLFKTVQHQDGVAQVFTGGQRTFDLTPFLGPSGSILTSKTLAGEVAGAATITFADQVDPQTQDTVAALAEPMDMIEIRATRDLAAYAGGPLPLLMRCFVTSVRRQEQIGPDGTPRRVVTITAHDAGKFWRIHQIFFQFAVVLGEPLLTVFQMQAATGMQTALMPVSQFMTNFVTKVMNEKIAQFSAAANRQIPPFTIQSSVQDGQVVPQAAGAITPGPLWNIIARFADRPWNELFVVDQETGPVLVFRPAPLRGIDGNLVMDGAVDPGTATVDIKDVVSLDMVRSDARVSNLFWVPPGSASLDTSAFVNASTLVNADTLDLTYGNNLPAIYGERMLECTTNLVPDDLGRLANMIPAGQRGPALAAYPQWYSVRAAQLKAMNRDNGVWEEGTIVVKGSEDYSIGLYLELTRGAVTSDAYVIQVSHRITPLATWTTSMALERGTGFLVRNKMSGSPYWQEGRSGPYSAAKAA